MGVQSASSSPTAPPRPDNQPPAGPSEDELTSLFEAAMKRSEQQQQQKQSQQAADDKRMTPEEQQKFLKAMQDPEFRSLLDEYMREISDPANRRETEQYLAQLEHEQRVPTDKQLIRPTPGFVVKVKWREDDGPTEHKVFVNICHSDKLQPPSSTHVAASRGTSWSLPYSIGPERMESDRGGGLARTYDVCFHPRTVQFAMSQRPYRDMVVHTALEAVEAQLRVTHRKPTGTLTRSFHVLKGVTYKSGEPVTMCLKKEREEEPPRNDTTKPKPAPTTTAATTTAKSLIPAAPSTITTQSRAATATSPAVNKDSKPLMEEVTSRKTRPATTTSTPTTQRKKLSFQLVYRGQFEMMDHMQRDLGGEPRDCSRPKELVVEIACPEHMSARGIDLDVNDTTVKVQTSGYEPLSITLPYPVVEAKGSARFDKRTRKLVVTLPVQPPPRPEKATRLVIAETSAGTDEEEDAEESTTNKTNDETAAVPVVPAPASASPAARSPPPPRDDAFAMVRETALMVANDPLYQPRPPRETHVEATRQPETLSPDVHNSQDVNTQVTMSTDALMLDEKVKKHVADDALYDDLPPLESCSEDEWDEEDATQAPRQPPTSEFREIATPRPSLTPPFTVKDTAKCRSYLVDVRGVDSSSVVLQLPSSTSFVLQFTASAASAAAEECVHYELQVDDIPVPVDPQTAEWSVATENMAVILTKADQGPIVADASLSGNGDDLQASPPPPPPPMEMQRFQNDLLYELD